MDEQESPCSESVLRATLREELARFGEVWFPDWSERFSAGADPEAPMRDQLMSQLRMLFRCVEYRAICIAVSQAVGQIVLWKESGHDFDPDLPALEAIGEKADEFVKRYLPDQVDNAFMDRMGVTHYDVYQRTCLDWLRLGRIASVLNHGWACGDETARAWCNDANHAFLRTLGSLIEPGGALTVCEPGMVTHMADAVRSLCHRLCPPSLPERFKSLRYRVFEQTVLKHVRHWSHLFFNVEGNEVHIFNAWLRYHGGHFGLPVRDFDTIAHERMLGPDVLQMSVLEELSLVLNPVNSLLSLTEDCMQAFRAALPEPYPDGGFTPEACHQALVAISPEWGDIPLDALIVWDDETLRCTVRSDPDLVFAHLLSTILATPELPASLAGLLACILNCGVELSRPTATGGMAGLPPDPVGLARQKRQGSPRLYVSACSEAPGLLAWIERRWTLPNEPLRIERTCPELDDFSDALLCHVFRSPPTPPGIQFATQPVPDHSVFCALIKAWWKAEAGSIAGFAARSVARDLGLGDLVHWPGLSSFAKAVDVFMLHMDPDGRMARSFCPDYPFSVLQFHSILRLFERGIVEPDLRLLSGLVSRGYLNPSTPIREFEFCQPVENPFGPIFAECVRRGELPQDVELFSLDALLNSGHWAADHPDRDLLATTIDRWWGRQTGESSGCHKHLPSLP